MKKYEKYTYFEIKKDKRWAEGSCTPQPPVTDFRNFQISHFQKIFSKFQKFHISKKHVFGKSLMG